MESLNLKLLIYVSIFIVLINSSFAVYSNVTSYSLLNMSGTPIDNAIYASSIAGGNSVCQGFKIIGEYNTYRIINVTVPLARNGAWTTGTYVRAYVLNQTTYDASPSGSPVVGDYGNNTFASPSTEIPSTAYLSPTNYTINWESTQTYPVVNNNTHYYLCIDANGDNQHLYLSLASTTSYPYGTLWDKLGGVWGRDVGDTDFAKLIIYGEGVSSTVINYTILGNIYYNSTAIQYANISLLSRYGQSVLSTTQSNSTGGYKFADLSNTTYYSVFAYLNDTYTASGVVLMNDSMNLTKNLDFYTAPTTSSCVSDYGNWFFVPDGCVSST